ncbi:MAG: hypothetical protein QT03_C0001G0135 [archaeon GW2011_AR10]|nr:MAG: hypothetical protein QT03_C0001G0135 [archaeon GW2011_AR10]
MNPYIWFQHKVLQLNKNFRGDFLKILESNTIVLVLSFLLLGTTAFNIFLQGEISSELSSQKAQLSTVGLVSATTPVTGTQGSQVQGSPVISFEEFLPKGVPPVYGQELGVSFDKPVESLAVLSALDGDLYPNGKMKFSQLSEQNKQDYIKIGMSIACEYCCGATSLIAPNGQPACGCAHSAAMRGLAMYLLENHRSELTNEQILEQLTLWKTMFFPKQMYEEAVQLQAAGSGLTPSVIDQVPDMVGGC